MSKELLGRASVPLLTLPYEAWHFGDSVAFEAMVSASDHLQDERYLRFCQGFARGWAAARPEFEHFDMTAPGAALCEVSERTGDVLLRDQLIRLGEHLCERPTLEGVYQSFSAAPLREGHRTEPLEPWESALLVDPGPGVFLDCLHFDPPFFARLATITGDAVWAERAVTQALGYIRLLQDSATGLFHHFYLERTGHAHILGWGRGQGWGLLGILEVLEQAEPGDSTLPLEESARAVIHAMLETQRSDGHWDAVVHRPQSGVETSTAAFMVTAFTRAVRQGIVDIELVQDSRDRALAAMVASMDADAVLRGVSVAVWASTSLTHYDAVPRDFLVPWGQGPAVLALCAVLDEVA